MVLDENNVCRFCKKDLSEQVKQFDKQSVEVLHANVHLNEKFVGLICQLTNLNNPEVNKCILEFNDQIKSIMSKKEVDTICQEQTERRKRSKPFSTKIKLGMD